MDEFESIFGRDEFSAPEVPAAPSPQVAQPAVPKKPHQALREKSVDDQLKELVSSIPDVPDEPVEEVRKEKGFIKSIWDGITSAFVQTSRNVTIAKRQFFGESIEDIPVKNEDTTFTENFTRDALLYGAPAVAGAKTGAVLGGLTGPLAPVAIPAGAVLGGIAGGFVGAFFDDPRSTNLADVVKKNDESIKGFLKGTPIEDLDVVVDAFAENLAKKEGDDLFTMRLKNATTDLYTGVLFTPLAWIGEFGVKSAARATQKVAAKAQAKAGAKQVTETQIKEAIEEVIPAAKPAAEGAEQAVKEQPSIIAAGAKQDEVYSDEFAMALENFEKSLDVHVPAQVKETVETAADGTRRVKVEVPPDVKPNIADETLVSRVSMTAKRFVEEYKEMRTLDKVSFKKAIKEARLGLSQEDRVKIAAGEIDTSMEGLAKTLAYMEEVAEDYLRVLDIPVNGDPAVVLAKQEATENLFQLAKIWTDVGTEQSRAFGFRRMLGQLALDQDTEAMRAIGSAGKFRAVRGLIERKGGEAAIGQSDALAIEALRIAADPTSSKIMFRGQEIRGSAEILADIRAILARPDSDFMLDRAGEVVAKSPYRKSVDILTAYISDNVLSAWSTANAISGGLTDMTLKSASNYMKAGLRAATMDRRAAKIAFIEANIFAGELISNFASSLKMGVDAFRMGKDSKNIKTVTGAINVGEELQRGVKALFGIEEQAKHGTVLNYIAPAYGLSIGLGRRMLVGWDVAATNMARMAVIRSKLAVKGLSEGVDPARIKEYVEGVISANRVPKDIMDQAELLGQQWAYAARPEMAVNKAIEQFTQDAPLFKVFNLFFRAKANSIERTLEYIPGAAFFLLPSQRAAFKAGGEALAEAAAKQATGGLLLGAGYMLYEMGYATPEPPRGLRNKDYWSPDLEKGVQGRDPNTITTPVGSFRLPMGSPMEKIIKLSGALHQLIQATDNDEAEAMVEAASMAVATILSDPSAYQTDLDFLFNLLNTDVTKENLATFTTNQLMKVVPLRSTAQKIGQLAGTDEFLRDLSPAAELGAIDYMIEHAQNRLLAIYDSRGFVAQRNIFGEKLTRPQGFMGISVFSGPGSDLDPTLEAMRTIEEYGINRPNQGFVNVDFRLPSRMMEVELFSTPGFGDTEPAVPRVQLPTKFYEKLLDYYAQGGGNGLTLRERLEIEVRSAVETLSQDSSPEMYNFVVGRIHGALNEADAFAREMLRRDPEFIEWKLERAKKIQDTRSKLPAIEIERFNQKINREIGL
jgi:hypothetical protein